MIKEEKKITEVITQHRHCDVCDTEMIRNRNCCICGKDLCLKCVEHTEDEGGDYSYNYCKKCWDKGLSFRSKIKELEEQIDDLRDEWELECKK